MVEIPVSCQSKCSQDWEVESNVDCSVSEPLSYCDEEILRDRFFKRASFKRVPFRGVTGDPFHPFEQ
eukprot:294949-Heterocapsa_arctica.AAC.1